MAEAARRMTETPPAAPTVQLLAWIAERSRSYAETIEVWKTSCPRLAVWEDALADDLVRVERGYVVLTGAGRELVTAPPPRMGS
ncbi:MAG: hypothetical protein ACM33B_11735 [Pseudomonadota bacterium]